MFMKKESHLWGLLLYNIPDLMTCPITQRFTSRLLPKFGENNGLIYAEDSFTGLIIIFQLHEK